MRLICDRRDCDSMAAGFQGGRGGELVFSRPAPCPFEEKLYFTTASVSPSVGQLSTCSKVDHIHCGRLGVLWTMWKPTSPTVAKSHVSTIFGTCWAGV